MGIKNKKIILVEGSSDVSFFEALLKNRGLGGFDVFSPSINKDRLGGEDAIIPALKSLEVDRQFSNVEKILIVVDSDNNPAEKFDKFKNLIRNTSEISGTSNKYPIPSTPSVFASIAGSPQIAITMLPSDISQGAMETLCWNVVEQGNPGLTACVLAFETCVNLQDWSPQKVAKFRLRSVISASYNKNPDLPTTQLWNEMPELIPLDSNIFDPLAQYLRSI